MYLDSAVGAQKEWIEIHGRYYTKYFIDVSVVAVQ